MHTRNGHHRRPLTAAAEITATVIAICAAAWVALWLAMTL